MNKFLRDISYIGIRNVIKKQNKLYDQYLNSHRLPTYPKIVVYTSEPQAETFFEENLSQFRILQLTGKQKVTTDDALVKDIAATSSSVPENQFCRGVILKGFPFNRKQAYLLDLYLNGINLAIFLGGKNTSEQYVESIKELLTYYEERGNLLRWNVENSTENDQFYRQYVATIKKSQ